MTKFIIISPKTCYGKVLAVIFTEIFTDHELMRLCFVAYVFLLEESYSTFFAFLWKPFRRAKWGEIQPFKRLPKDYLNVVQGWLNMCEVYKKKLSEKKKGE